MVPTIILMLALPKFLPASPIRLLKEGNEKEALKSLTSFQNRDAALNQLHEFQREIRSERIEGQTKIGCIGLLRHSRSTLIICLLLNATVSFSGIISISFFGTFLLQNIGFSGNGAALANCLASFSGILGNIIGSLTIDKCACRVEHCSAILIFYFQVTNDYRTGYAFLTLLIAFFFVFSLGVGPSAWFIATELSSVEARDRIQSLSVSCQYITCFISSLVFLPLYHNTGAWSFLLFICPLSFCAIYLFVFLPETKGRQIEEILDELQQRSLLKKTPQRE
ncbi:Transporter, major facilitator family protein [Aphelenchoides bicaudatus]|nr:Transporter, major facilitator family protein [Aphelenchoides bicaudatus]